MTVATDNAHEEVSLWTSFHDGTLQTLAHDALAGNLTLVIEVPYVATFHNMPIDTRFKVVLDKISLMESLRFQPWPGTRTPTPGLSWQEQEAMRTESLDKSYYQSTDWDAFTESLAQERDFEIINALISSSSNATSTLVLDIGDYTANIYLQIKATAANIHFFVNNDELDTATFLSLGAAYWTAFANRGTTAEAANEQDQHPQQN